MGHSKASIVVGLALVITVAICQVQLPCDSPLRPLPSLAIFFQHCDSLCRYNDWTDLIPYPHARPVPVPWYQCRSELAIYGERLQIPNNYHECTESMCETCETRREEGFVCNSTCRYSNWTELTPLNTSILTPVVVPQNVCLSGLGIPGERWQFAISGYECVGIRCGECMNKREERYICTCHYSNWTELLPTTTETVVPQTKCLSELGIQQVRWQFAISGYECTQTQCQECQDKMEENYICNSTCHYSNWTDVTPLVNATPIAVPYNQCSSQEASLGERWQFAISGYECEGSQCKECEDRKEERHICAPTITERIILAFELGSTGQSHTPIPNPPVYNCGSRKKRIPENPTEDDMVCTIQENICSATHVCDNVQGRRSVHEEKKSPYTSELLTPEPQPLPVDPIPFDLVMHSARYRRQSSSSNCYPDGARYVLFILDTSASIGPDYFNSMKSALSTLVQYFCRPIKIAAMTFSHEHFIEFCFNCFENDCEERDNARDAMQNIRYRIDGWTHTAVATQCACDCMLTTECGFPDLTTFSGPGAVCLDVIYVTDGHSNGPYNVCEKVACLYDLEQQGVELKVFAFGIGTNVRDSELRCITKSQQTASQIDNAIFKVNTFEHFATAIEAIGSIFDPNPSGGSGYISPIVEDCFTSYHMDLDGLDTDDCSESDRK